MGLIGAYTTFSTFAKDIYDFGAGREYIEAALNLIGSVGGGIVAVRLGTWIGRSL